MKSARGILLLASWILMAAFLTVSCSRKGAGEVLATVGDVEITRPRFEAYLKTAGLSEGTTVPERQKALKAMIQRTIAAHLAGQRGLVDESRIAAIEPSWREEASVFTYYQRRIEQEPDFTEKEIRGAFEQFNEERQISHIVCATREEADQVREKLVQGGSWKELAKAHSLDSVTAEKGGEMGWIKRSDISADLVDRIFDASEGSILEPFQSSGGWEIVLVTASRLPPDSTFALQRDDLLSSMKQQRAERIRRELVQEVQKKYPLTIVHEALPTADQDLRALPGDERTVVGKVGPRDITLQELKAFVLSVSRRKNTPPERGVAKMASYLTVLSGEKAVHAAAIEEGLPGSDAVDALVWNTRQDFVARLFSAEYLKEVPVSEAALALFHEKNPKLFRAPNELTVRIIEADTPKQLQDAVQDLKLGTPFGTLRKKYDVRRLHGGDPVPLDFSSPPPEIPPSYLRALATAPRGAWMGPFQAPTGIRAYEVVSSQEGGIRPVEEVGEELRRVYLSKRGEELLAAYLDGDGRKDIPVEILVEAP